MNRTRYLIAALAAVLSGLPAEAALRDLAPALEQSTARQTYVYKQTPQGELKLHIYLPEGWKPGQKRAAIVLFFGGGFTGGTTEQFTTKSEYLAGRGMVAITPEYRVKTRHTTGPDKSIEDAKSAMRWVRMHAAKLGVDPDRIAAGGGSAGGTCAALAAFSTDFEAPDEDKAIPARPAVLVLYNPALVVPGGSLEPPRGEEMNRVLSSWTVGRGAPPMVVFFGTEDGLLAASRELVRQSAGAGNRAELYTAAGQKHGFFNDTKTSRNGSPGWHEVTLLRTDLFLSSLGYLKGAPAIAADPGLKLVLEK